MALLKDKNYDLVLEDIKEVVDAAKPAIVKVIIEACLLSDEEIVKACELSVKAGAAFVKTSTGFSTGGCYGGRCSINEKDRRWKSFCKGKWWSAHS